MILGHSFEFCVVSLLALALSCLCGGSAYHSSKRKDWGLAVAWLVVGVFGLFVAGDGYLW